ncbi:MAG TPA: RIP metalloprotease RseP [Gemmatimonadales bacterium]|jgi:regulator of sigma E protease
MLTGGAYTVASFIIVVGVLIFVHELGHFLAAKALGVQVLRFSLGIGPAIRRLTFRRGETEYGISWLPIGGYVAMATLEDEGTTQALEGGAPTVPIDPERVFEKRPLWARGIIMVAGVTMNVLFAVIVFAVLARTAGVDRVETTQVDTVWVSQLPHGAEALGSLRNGDRIVAINGAPVSTWEELGERLFTSPSPIRVTIAGGREPLRLEVPMDEASRTALTDALDPSFPAEISEVGAGTPAADAGLRPGDRVIGVNGDSISSWYQFTRIVRASAGTALTLVVQRDSGRVTLVVTPRKQSVLDPHIGKNVEGGFLGVGPRQPVVHQQFGMGSAVVEGARRTVHVAGQVLAALKGLVTGQLPLRELGGPIRIGQVSGEVARQGLKQFVGFMALLSINLAILNLLPIPVLDGGGLMLLGAEAVRRRPLSREVRTRLTNAGLIVVAAVMLFAISNDVLGLFRR